MSSERSKPILGIIKWYGGKSNTVLKIFPEKTGFRHEWWINGIFEPKVELNDIESKLQSMPFAVEIKYSNNERDFISFMIEDEEIEIGTLRNEKTNENVPLLKIVETVQNRLYGPITLVTMQGNSISGKFENKGEKIDAQRVKEDPNFLFNHPDAEYKGVSVRKMREGTLEYKKVKGLSAELDGIHMLKSRGFVVDEVLYILFPPNDGSKRTPPIFNTLKVLTEAFFKAKVRSKFLSYFSSDEKSVLNSVQQLWNILRNEFSRDKKIVVDVGSGQKYPGIAAAFYCLLNNKEFYYNQASSKLITKFPPVPISWNFNLLDENLSSFRFLSKKESRNLKYSEYTSLPGFFKEWFDLSPNIGISTPLPLKEMFLEYENARKLPFGYGQKFIELIENDEMKAFINKNVSKWSLAWIGDQIPETVEHSQRHSKRLMEFVVNLVNVMGEERFLSGIPKNFKNEFYFILGVAMNVHDLGHTAVSYNFGKNKKIILDGLPSVVRDLHNELSYQLLENKDLNLLEGIEKMRNGENLKKGIALVSRYHRHHMPIDKIKRVNKEYVRIFEIDTSPLSEVVREVFDDENFMKITIMAARWLKFVDSTDVQSDRTVGEEYHKMRNLRTKLEIHNLCEDILSRADFWGKDILPFRENVEKIFELIQDTDKNSSDLEKVAKELEEKLYFMLEHYIMNSDEIVGVPDGIRKLDRIAFKARQFPHFKKHEFVKSIYPSSFDPYQGILEISIRHENDDEILLKNIKEDVKKEFKDSGLFRYAVKDLIFK